MTINEKRLIADRDYSLDGALLNAEGIVLNEDRSLLKDTFGDWWPIAWSSHLCRYESSIAHVDGILRRCSRCSGDSL